KTVRRWNLQSGEEIVEARVVCNQEVTAVAISRDGRWVITASGDRFKAGHDPVNAELKSCEVDTGIMRSFEGHSRIITCVDISANSKLLASGSADGTAQIWDLDTGKLMAGPLGDGTIIAVFSIIDDPDSDFCQAMIVYEFDALTLETVGTPFEGHSDYITCLALSFDCALLASNSLYDGTIKLWAFDS
ncbi:WD40 repeat-like protein, partial [Rhizopogon salebrosus TDB-379]